MRYCICIAVGIILALSPRAILAFGPPLSMDSLERRRSGTTIRVPLRGARRPPPGRGTPFTSITPRPAVRSMKWPRLTYISLPCPSDCMIF